MDTNLSDVACFILHISLWNTATYKPPKTGDYLVVL